MKSDKERVIAQIEASLTYAQEETEFARVLAQDEIKDPELVKKVEALKLGIITTRDYIKSKTDTKRG